MKDKRLDALLETLPELKCKYYWEGFIQRSGVIEERISYLCNLRIPGEPPPTTNCQGDIRKCEREK